jgi:hypothetical protein
MDVSITYAARNCVYDVPPDGPAWRVIVPPDPPPGYDVAVTSYEPPYTATVKATYPLTLVTVSDDSAHLVDITIDSNNDLTLESAIDGAVEEDEFFTFWVNNDSDGDEDGDGFGDASNASDPHVNGMTDLEDLASLDLAISAPGIGDSPVWIELIPLGDGGDPAIRLFSKGDVEGLSYLTSTREAEKLQDAQGILLVESNEAVQLPRSSSLPLARQPTSCSKASGPERH